MYTYFIYLIAQKQSTNPLFPCHLVPHSKQASHPLPPCAVHFLLSISEGGKETTRNGTPSPHQTTNPHITTSLNLLKMPTTWDAARERDLLEEIYFVLSSRQSLSQEDKDAVVEGMQQRGYANLKWNAIR